MDKTAEQIFEQKVRKVLQSVLLHGYDLICAEHDIIKANKEFHEAKLKEELIKFAKWFNSSGLPLISSTIDEYLKQR